MMLTCIKEPVWDLTLAQEAISVILALNLTQGQQKKLNYSRHNDA